MIKPSLSHDVCLFGSKFLSQGIIVVISIALGSASVAVFSTIRTLSNMAKQPLMIVSLAFWGEFTKLLKNKALVIKLFNLANSLQY
ncbi:MAG: hypothetical protein IPO98_06910 [Saprospiraceae bacterium]|nr:hypothetical protein [Saprospiraceae bacterium]